MTCLMAISSREGLHRLVAHVPRGDGDVYLVDVSPSCSDYAFLTLRENRRAEGGAYIPSMKAVHWGEAVALARRVLAGDHDIQEQARVIAVLSVAVAGLHALSFPDPSPPLTDERAEALR